MGDGVSAGIGDALNMKGRVRGSGGPGLGLAGKLIAQVLSRER